MRRTIPAAITLAATALALTACASASPSATTAASAPAAGAPATSAAAAQPQTETGVRAAAAQFYALYAAGQWSAAWAYLTPATKAAVPEATFTAVHQGCPSPSAGVARVIKSVTLAGSTAVVTETVSGAAGALGSVTDAWQYAGGRWGVELSSSAMAVYKHGSAAADIAAAKAAGDGASS
jgi:hypothetical protein